MQSLRRSGRLLSGWLWIVIVALAVGCQIEPNMPPAPAPFYPKDMFQMMPSKPKAEYTLSEDVTAMKPDPLDAKPRAK